MEFTIQALHDEIENDPTARGYKVGAVWKGDQEIADLINSKDFVIDQERVEMEAVRAATNYEWYNDLSIDEQEWMRWQTPNGGDWRVNADMKLQLTGRALAADGAGGSGAEDASFWAVADRTAAVATMLAIIEVPGSRAEVLWGADTHINATDVGAAANL